eukprot:COSAG02_NODE_24295_length_692_cov_1.600337_1_plen_30_part_10
MGLCGRSPASPSLLALLAQGFVVWGQTLAN